MVQGRADDTRERTDALPRLQLDEGEAMSGWQPDDRAVRSEFGIIRPMKVLVAVILLPLAALGVTVSPLPFDAAVLSEATTNIW